MAKPDKIKGQQDRILVIDDEKHRALDLSQMNIVPPNVGIFDEPTRCYRVNHEWAKIVMGIVGWLAEVAVWRDADNEGYFAILEILRFKQGEPCMDFQLRQNPTDACQLEQSFDGGDTWLIAFDYSLCQVGEDGAISIEALEQQLIRINERFEELMGDIPQLYPRLEYDMTSADDIRDLALCAALHDLVDFICELVLEERENEALIARIGAIILGITSAALIASGIGSPLGLAIATLLVAGYATVWDGVSNAVLGDDEARALVACCMYNALSGTTIDQTAFETSLDLCDFDELTNEAQIAGAIAGMLDDDDMYQTFVEFWDEKYRPAELGLVTCDACAEWESILDFTVSDYGIIEFAQCNGGDVGTWQNGVGLVAVNLLGDSCQYGVSAKALNFTINFDNTEVNEFEVESVFTRGSYNAGNLNFTAYRTRLMDGSTSYPSSTTSHQASFFTQGVATPINTVKDGLGLNPTNKIEVYMRPGENAQNGSAVLSQMILRGEGIKPPQLP